MSHQMASPPIRHDALGKHAWRDTPAEERRGARVAGYLAAIVVNVVLIVVARSLQSWGVPFITGDFAAALPAIERSLVATIVANAMLCAYDPQWVRHFARVVMNAFALNATLALARIFPFDFGSPTGNDLARLALLLAVIGVLIAILAEAVQMLLALSRRDAPGDA